MVDLSVLFEFEACKSKYITHIKCGGACKGLKECVCVCVGGCRRTSDTEEVLLIIEAKKEVRSL